MTQYSCEKCGKTFNRKDTYNKHKNRKGDCTKGLQSVVDINNKLDNLEEKVSNMYPKTYLHDPLLSVKDHVNSENYIVIGDVNITMNLKKQTAIEIQGCMKKFENNNGTFEHKHKGLDVKFKPDSLIMAYTEYDNAEEEAYDLESECLKILEEKIEKTRMLYDIIHQLKNIETTIDHKSHMLPPNKMFHDKDKGQIFIKTKGHREYSILVHDNSSDEFQLKNNFVSNEDIIKYIIKSITEYKNNYFNLNTTMAYIKSCLIAEQQSGMEVAYLRFCNKFIEDNKEEKSIYVKNTTLLGRAFKIISNEDGEDGIIYKANAFKIFKEFDKWHVVFDLKEDFLYNGDMKEQHIVSKQEYIDMAEIYIWIYDVLKKKEQKTSDSSKRPKIPRK